SVFFLELRSTSTGLNAVFSSPLLSGLRRHADRSDAIEARQGRSPRATDRHSWTNTQLVTSNPSLACDPSCVMNIVKGKGEEGGTGYILLWLLGIPIPVLFLIFLLRGCT